LSSPHQTPNGSPSYRSAAPKVRLAAVGASGEHRGVIVSDARRQSGLATPTPTAQTTPMTAPSASPMLTASEVANLLHLHVNTVKRLGDRGELPFFRVCKRGDRRYRVEDVMEFLTRNR
jgi:excisionase family DNA binding protein